ncbi:MAG: lipoprotein insertase outer membrane protein LolB [Methylophilaceae bacterium]
MAFNRRLFLWCTLAFYLTGCATAPILAPPTTALTAHLQHLTTLASIQQFSLEGRLGIVTNPKGFSGGIDWQHEASHDNIEIFSPLGGKIAHIVKTASEVTLTTQDGHTIKAQDAETLTETALGWRLPLSGLNDWALGKPTNGKIDAATWDEQGRLITLKQNGWDIEYANYTESNGYFLPSKIVLKSEKVNLKLLVEKWAGL